MQKNVLDLYRNGYLLERQTRTSNNSITEIVTGPYFDVRRPFQHTQLALNVITSIDWLTKSDFLTKRLLLLCQNQVLVDKGVEAQLVQFTTVTGVLHTTKWQFRQ